MRRRGLAWESERLQLYKVRGARGVAVWVREG